MVDESDILNNEYWRHRIELDSQLTTPGHRFNKSRWKAFGLPEDMTGKSFLDVGAADGLFAFEAERRGADDVLATDVWDVVESHSEYEEDDDETSLKSSFELAHGYLGSDVDSKTIDILDISPETIGTYDYVLCSGVLGVISDPITAIDNLSSVANEKVVVTISCHKLLKDKPTVQLITDGRPQLWRYNQEFIKEAFELRADCEVTSFPSTRSENQKPLEDITSGKVTDDTTVYRTYSLEDPRFDVTAGTEVAILYKKESAYRINYRSSSASKPKQGWVSRQQIDDDATDSVGLVKKGLQILQEEGSKEFVKSTKDYVFNTSPPGELEVFHVEF